MGLTSGSSSDDDDNIYVNPAARLKALKKKPPVVVNDEADLEDSDSSNFWRTKATVPANKKPMPSRRVHRPLRSSREINSNEIENDERNNERDREPRDLSPDVVIVTTEEEDLKKFSNGVDSLNCSSASVNLEDDNYNVVVNVKWRSRKVVRLELRKYESFEKVFQHFAELEGVSPKQVLIWRGSQTINRTDTPASVDLRIIDILEGGIVDSEVAVPENAQQQNQEDDNICKIKVQMSTKQKIMVNLRMDETFKTVMLTCSEQLSVKPGQIKLSFDGEDIAMTDTPESLDLEQEACIDLRLLTN